MGTSTPVMRSGGASRSSKHSSTASAITSAGGRDGGQGRASGRRGERARKGRAGGAEGRCRSADKRLGGGTEVVLGVGWAGGRRRCASPPARPPRRAAPRHAAPRAAPAPTPCCGQPSSTEITRRVLRIEAASPSRSMGLSVRRLSTYGGGTGGAAGAGCLLQAHSLEPRHALESYSPPTHIRRPAQPASTPSAAHSSANPSSPLLQAGPLPAPRSTCRQARPPPPAPHLAADPVLLQHLGGAQRVPHHLAERHQRDVAALAHDLRTPGSGEGKGRRGGWGRSGRRRSQANSADPNPLLPLPAVHLSQCQLARIFPAPFNSASRRLTGRRSWGWAGARLPSPWTCRWGPKSPCPAPCRQWGRTRHTAARSPAPACAPGREGGPGGQAAGASFTTTLSKPSEPVASHDCGLPLTIAACLSSAGEEQNNEATGASLGARAARPACEQLLLVQQSSGKCILLRAPSAMPQPTHHHGVAVADGALQQAARVLRIIGAHHLVISSRSAGARELTGGSSCRQACSAAKGSWHWLPAARVVQPSSGSRRPPHCWAAADCAQLRERPALPCVQGTMPAPPCSLPRRCNPALPLRAHLEPRNRRIPGRKALRVLRRHARGRAVGAAEHHGHGDLTGAHVVVLGGGVDDLGQEERGKEGAAALLNLATGIWSALTSWPRPACTQLLCLVCHGAHATPSRHSIPPCPSEELTSCGSLGGLGARLAWRARSAPGRWLAWRS